MALRRSCTRCDAICELRLPLLYEAVQAANNSLLVAGIYPREFPPPHRGGLAMCGGANEDTWTNKQTCTY